MPRFLDFTTNRLFQRISFRKNISDGKDQNASRLIWPQTKAERSGSAMLEATFALFILMLTLLPLANLLNDTSAIISTDRSQVTAIYLANNYLSAYRAEAAKTTNSTFPGTAPALVSPQLVGTTEFTITLPQPPGWCLFTDSGGTGVWGNGTPLTPSNAGYWVVVDVTWGNKAHLVTEAALLTMPPNMASSSAAPPGVPLSATACPV